MYGQTQLYYKNELHNKTMSHKSRETWVPEPN